MRAWLRRLFGVADSSPPRLVDVINRLEDVEERIDHLAHAIKTLRGRVTGAIRHQDDAGDESEGEADPPAPRGTAHLKRALRGF